MQLLEDMDVSGLYGNMIDILKFLIKEKNLATYKKGIPLVQTKSLLTNKESAGAIYSKKHRLEVEKVLKSLYQIKIEGKDFKSIFLEVKKECIRLVF
jgi:hypothetical protein